MKNEVYCFNVEDKIGSEIDTRTNRYLASHTHNQSSQVTPTFSLAEATNEKIKPIESDTFTFAYPNKIAIKKTKATTIEEFCFFNSNDQYCYATFYNQDNMSLIKTTETERNNNKLVTDTVEPKKKRLRKKKLSKQDHVAMLNWESLSFLPEIEAKYDCNVKPHDYVQYLNNPVCDPMFCQFDGVNDKPHYNGDAIHEFE